MKTWDDREKDHNYRRPTGKFGTTMRILFVGSVSFMALYITTIVIDSITYTPPIVP